jgi:type I restriction enzyme S subunit
MGEQDMKNRKGFKETKLGWIPEDWEVIEIKDVLTIGSGKDYKHLKKGSIPVYGSGGIMTFVDKYLYDGESVGIGRKGTIDKPVLLDGKFWTVDTLFYTHSFKGTIPKFVFNVFLTIPWKRYNAASSIPSLSKTTIDNIKIKLPPLSEQKAIANCLSTWETDISKQDALIKEKQQLKKALMQQLLSGKKRLSGFSGGWQENRLDFFFEERSERNNKGYQLLSIGEAGVYPQDNSNKKDTSNNDKSKYKKICVGDIGYNTMRMWQGRSALSSLEGIVSPAYTIVKPKENTDSQFFAYLFKDPAVIHRFFRNSQGMVSDTLNCKFKDFAIIKLLLPTNKEEQIAIAQVLKIADQEINLLTNQRNQLQLQKKGLMQQLLTGKKRLKV